MKDPQTINAVYDKDLERVLKDLELYEPLMKGQLTCFLCGSRITMENVNFIFPKNGRVQIVCDKQSCSQRLEDIIGDADKS